MRKSHFNFDEQMMLLLYSPGYREGMIEVLNHLLQCLAPDEIELRTLAASVLDKVKRMTDQEFDLVDADPSLYLNDR